MPAAPEMPSLSRSPLARLAWAWRRGRLHRYCHLAAVSFHAVPAGFRLLFLRLQCLCERRPLLSVALVEHFGDIVACEPVARHLRRLHPRACILWCSRPAYRELLDHNPNVDRVLPVLCLSEWMLLRRTGLAGQLIDLHAVGRSCPVCCIPFQRSDGDPAVTINNYYQFGPLLRAFARAGGLPDIELSGPCVFIPPATVPTVDRFNLPPQFIVIHARANEPERDWEAPKWSALLDAIHSQLNIPTVEIGLAPLVAESPQHRNLCGATSFLELAEIIRRAALFIGLDSGPAHLANAAGIPGVILLGHYRSFKHYLPYTGGYAAGAARLVYADGPVASLSVAEVFAAVRNLWSGMPAPVCPRAR